MDQAAPATPTASTSSEPARLRPVVALRRGRDTFAAFLGPSFRALTLPTVLSFAGGMIPAGWSYAFSILLAPVLWAVCARYAVRTIRGESPGFASVRDGFRRWPTVTGSSLVLFLAGQLIFLPATLTSIAKAGLASLWRPLDLPAMGPAVYGPVVVMNLVCFVPMMWFMARTWPLAFVVMEPDAPDVRKSLRRTWTMTRGSAWRAAGLGALSVPVFLLGLICLCVGIIPASIVLCYASAHAYEMLRGVEPAAAPAADELASPPVVASPAP